MNAQPHHTNSQPHSHMRDTVDPEQYTIAAGRDTEGREAAVGGDSMGR
jgi:hypothetical protein